MYCIIKKDKVFYGYCALYCKYPTTLGNLILKKTFEKSDKYCQ